MESTYLFYDIEATGLNKCFDQVVQFAAIRTDLALNELERHQFLVRLNPDVIPHPQAVFVHGLGPEELKDGLSEREAIRRIHALFNTPGTISLGYNTLGFDDEFLRFSFYRNLLSPYTHQYANRCRRMDLYPLAIIYRLFKPGIAKWPIRDDRPSMRLEHIQAENHWHDGAAHDALVDVEVTLTLAKKMFAEKEMWDYLQGFFDKQEDSTRAARMPEVLNSRFGPHRQALFFDGILGAAQHYQAPVLSLGGHQHYRNQSLWLRLDQANLSETTLDNIAENTWVFRKKTAEKGLLLPPQPRFMQYLSEERKTCVENNLRWLALHQDILEAIVEHHRNFTFPAVSGVDVDAYLYQADFWTSEENGWCHQFHSASGEQQSKLLEQTGNALLRDLGLRVLGRENSAALSDEQQQDFRQYLHTVFSEAEEKPLLDYMGRPKLRFSEALSAAEALQSEHPDHQPLRDLIGYLQKQQESLLLAE